MKRLHYVMGLSFVLLCGLIGWWWQGVYAEERDQLLLEAETQFQTWRSDVIGILTDDLLGFTRAQEYDFPAGADPDTIIRLDFTSRRDEIMKTSDSVSIRIDLSTDTQQVVSENFISRERATDMIDKRVQAANDKATGDIRLVVFNVGGDTSYSAHGSLLLSDTLKGGPFLGRAEYQIGYENYRRYLLRQMLPEIGLGLLVIACLGFSFWLTLRNLHEQRLALEAKDNFISNITHELKTPIATVGVALEALENFGADQNPTRRREYLDIGRRELDRLSRLTERALGILQFDNQEVTLDRSSLNLAELVRAAWDSLHHKYQLAPDRLHLEVSGSSAYYGDRLHLQNLLFNLLDNACKYGGNPPKIDVRITEGTAGIRLEVADNGAGIPPAEREKIFRKFYRIRDAKGHRIKGHGLGLSYAREVVESHGGRIFVQDADAGEGAVLVVNFPKISDDE